MAQAADKVKEEASAAQPQAARPSGAASIGSGGQKLPSRLKRTLAQAGGTAPGAPAGIAAGQSSKAVGGGGAEEEAERMAKKARLQEAAEAREKARLLLAAKVGAPAGLVCAQ